MKESQQPICIPSEIDTTFIDILVICKLLEVLLGNNVEFLDDRQNAGDLLCKVIRQGIQKYLYRAFS